MSTYLTPVGNKAYEEINLSSSAINKIEDIFDISIPYDNDYDIISEIGDYNTKINKEKDTIINNLRNDIEILSSTLFEGMDNTILKKSLKFILTLIYNEYFNRNIYNEQKENYIIDPYGFYDTFILGNKAYIKLELELKKIDGFFKKFPNTYRDKDYVGEILLNIVDELILLNEIEVFLNILKENKLLVNKG